MADHFRTAHLGHCHFPSLHDWNPNTATIVHYVLSFGATGNRHSDMVLVHSQRIPSSEQCGMSELCVRSGER